MKLINKTKNFILFIKVWLFSRECFYSEIKKMICGIDILLTANPDLLLNKPNNKTR